MGGGISRTKNRTSRNQQGRLVPSPAVQSPRGSASKPSPSAQISGGPERCVALYQREPSEKAKPVSPGRLRTLRAPGAHPLRQDKGILHRPRTPSASQSGDHPPSSAASVDQPAPSLKEKEAFSINRSNFILENAGKIQSLYEFDPNTLGSGTYGSVSRAVRRSTGMQRAVKTISKSQVKSMERFRREIDIMKSLVETLYFSFRLPMLRLCEGGELFDRIIAEGHFTEKRAALLMRQIFSAVNYLHSNHIMHRDLKPENFLFLSPAKDSALKIIDFGLSCRFKPGEFVTTKAGTPYYVAPQVLEGRYDFRCDAWSLGVILYILLCGFPPFYGDTDAEVLAQVKTGAYSFAGPEWRRVSDEGKDLIRKLLKINPDERLLVEDALHHPWIVSLAQSSQNVPLPVTLMANLKGFRAQNRLKKAALTVIAQHMTDSDIDHLRKIFVSLDVDHSGTLSVQEVAEGLKRLGWTEIPPDLQAIMEEDGNGKISQDELRQVLGMPNVQGAVGSETISALLNEVDLNGDGEIDFEEFMHMMRKRTPGEVQRERELRKRSGRA
ncbi:hypothetical protein ACSSS7_000357 [Eimeria intestinalis]